MINTAELDRRIMEVGQAAQRLERGRRLRPLERQFGREVGQWFRAQGAEITAVLEPVLGRRFDVAAPRQARDTAVSEAAPHSREAAPHSREAITQEEWDYLIDRMLRGDPLELGKVIDAFTGLALLAGGQGLYDNMGVGVTFKLENPRAVAYAQDKAAGLVSGINETSRGRLNRLLVQAVDEGWSWTRTANSIQGLFDDFSVKRAQAIARYEMGDAYVAGNEIAAQGLQDIGLRMEKSWLSAGDDRVRPAHQANEAAGWIPIGEVFPSGDERPPTDPGCRCDVLYQRAEINN